MGGTLNQPSRAAPCGILHPARQRLGPKAVEGDLDGDGVAFSNSDIEVATREMLVLVARLRGGSNLAHERKRLVDAGAKLRKRNK